MLYIICIKNTYIYIKTNKIAKNWSGGPQGSPGVPGGLRGPRDPLGPPGPQWACPEALMSRGD